MTGLIDLIDTVIALTENEQHVIKDMLTEKSFSRGQIIYSKGDICRHILFVKEGCARSYFSDSNDREFTLNFHFNDKDAQFKNLFIFDYASFLSAQPTHLYFEAMSDLTVSRLSKNNLEQLYSVNPKFQIVGRLMAEHSYQNIHNRVMSLLTLTAEARYKDLLNNEAYLLQKFQQYYIASYLGITASSLSRLRADFFRE